MKFAASTPAFDRALSVEIAASEQIRMRVLAGTLAILLLGDQLLFLFARETLEQFAGRSLPTWLPLKVFGPFLAYEILALVVLRYRRGRGKSMPTAARFANAVIETRLPTVMGSRSRRRAKDGSRNRGHDGAFLFSARLCARRGPCDQGRGKRSRYLNSARLTSGALCPRHLASWYVPAVRDLWAPQRVLTLAAGGSTN